MYNKEFEKLFQIADKKVDGIEISLHHSKSFSVRIHNHNIDSFNYAENKGIGIRIIKDGKVGYSYTEEFSDEAFNTIVDEAIAGSIYVENADSIVLDKYPDITQRLNIYSDELDKVSVEQKIELAKKLETTALEKDKRVFNVPSSSYSDGFRYTRIANNNGLDKEFKSNYCMASVMVLAAEDDDKKSGHWYYFGRNFDEIDADFIAGKAVSKAIELLNSSSPESGQYPVVLTNEMVTSLLSTFSGVFSAKNVQDGRSLLKGKIGTKIANPSVTIYDDGLHPEGLSSAPFDDEGYPAQKTLLIDKGVLKSFLHNTVTAAKDKTSSTGNASRGIRTPLTVGKTNLILEPQENSLNSMYNYSEKVIEVVSLQGLHSGANAISGDFSLSAEGFLYENGKRTKSLNNFTLSGNFFQCLNDVLSVGDNFMMSYNACGAPSLLIDNLVIGSK